MLARGVCLLHNNAHPQTAHATQELLQSFKCAVLAHPPHSPDLSFSKSKESLAGKTFLDDEVQDTVMTWLEEQAGNFYDAGIKKLVPRLTKCIAIHDDYVKK
jgi:hypothetical protein